MSCPKSSVEFTRRVNGTGEDDPRGSYVQIVVETERGNFCTYTFPTHQAEVLGRDLLRNSQKLKEDRKLQTIHELNTISWFWDAVNSGAKTFEVRKNNRAFQTGDILVLTRTDEMGRNDTLPSDRNGKFSKSQISFKITYLLQGGQFGIEPGYCVLGLGPIEDEH